MRERGNAMVLALIVLSGLAVIAGLTMVSVQGGIATTSSEQFHAIAMTAAESGAAVAMECMRTQVDPATGWSAFVSPSNTAVQSPACAGNGVAPGSAGNVLSTDQNAWYRIEVLNNRDDSGYAAGVDADRRIVIRSTGHGPNEAIAVIEWDVHAEPAAMQLTLVGWRVVE